MKVPPSGKDHSSCAALSFASFVLDETICLDLRLKRLAMRSLPTLHRPQFEALPLDYDNPSTPWELSWAL
jgi:hypothetical protein